ncbi:hypothetical protein [Paenibacillus radicis (ex Xue et al. 2023)]|uniref:Uncharacterized protein n=1 Tax=Paenibacillus radicis (ex Xue et al. 2023) TaxID=2972489 RepID=A0ABT1YJX3_9BACL|nr:hypothetical protein [Paenibacillus radicis (ex Xue et al. 2023)]MCR8633491.1 hypothetical protein [Paenibacillus radicis (ex Xue et al. 2023)]
MSANLIDAVFTVLSDDPALLALLGLNPSSSDDHLVARLHRGIEPHKPITEKTAPQICMYVKPGRFGRNHLVFEGKFCLDFYGKTSYQVKQLFERSFALFHDDNIQAAGFHSFRCTLAYDADMATGITGIKGYTAMFDVDYIRTNPDRR